MACLTLDSEPCKVSVSFTSIFRAYRKTVSEGQTNKPKLIRVRFNSKRNACREKQTIRIIDNCVEKFVTLFSLFRGIKKVVSVH